MLAEVKYESSALMSCAIWLGGAQIAPIKILSPAHTQNWKNVFYLLTKSVCKLQNETARPQCKPMDTYDLIG